MSKEQPAGTTYVLECLVLVVALAGTITAAFATLKPTGSSEPAAIDRLSSQPTTSEVGGDIAVGESHPRISRQHQLATPRR